MTNSPLFYILSSVFCSSLAHFALKLAAPRFLLHGTLWDIFLRLASNGWLIAGIALHVFALGLWVIALKRVDLSFAYPFIALGFVFIALLSTLLLKESISGWRLAGMILIVIGVSIIARD